MTRVSTSGIIQGAATVVAAIVATAVTTGILSGTGFFTGTGNTSVATDAGLSGNSLTFFRELFGYAIGSAPVATNVSGTIQNNGTDCTTLGATCGQGKNEACCKGKTTRAFNHATTCGTTFGTTGPKWVEQSGASQHATIVDDFGTTRITVASNGAVLPQATINVVSTADFATTTTSLQVGSGGLVTCTGKSPTAFTGCSGGSGTLTTDGPVEDDSVRPLGLPSLGHAIEIKAASSDDARVAMTIGTQAGDPACVLGICDATQDVNTDPMLTGVYYLRVMAWALATSSSGVFGSCHLHQGVNFGITCGAGAQDKENEREQVWGDNNTFLSGGKKTYIEARTCGTAACPNGSSSASTFGASIQVDKVPHVIVLKIENDVNATCTTPDDNGTAVTCAAGNHEAITQWIDQSLESNTPSRARVIIENWGNSHRLNTIECSGTHAMRYSAFCGALSYDSALRCSP